MMVTTRRPLGVGTSKSDRRDHSWAGAAGTGFYVDPKDDIIVVWMTQGQPGMARRYDRYLFKQMVYQAIVE